MTPTLIYDFVDNNRSAKVIKEVLYLEDYIEQHPEKEEVVTAVYSLFSVNYEDGTEEKLIISLTESANIVLPCTEDMLKDLFPDYLQKNDSDNN
jgi:hypothetical protein